MSASRLMLVLITDTGRVLTETMAIAHWLCARDTTHRISFASLTAQQDRLVQLAAYINTGFTGAFGPLWTAMELPEPDPHYERHLKRLGVAEVIDRSGILAGRTPWFPGRDAQINADRKLS